MHRRFRKRWRRPQILQFCGDDRRIRQEPRPNQDMHTPYTSIVPAKMQDLRPSPSFTKSSMWGLLLRSIEAMSTSQVCVVELAREDGVARKKSRERIL